MISLSHNPYEVKIMKEVVHFNSQKERLAYLKGEFEEIIPEEVKSEPKKAVVEEIKAEPEKKSPKKKSKKAKKEEDNGQILAE